jgi:hypothetical protein
MNKSISKYSHISDPQKIKNSSPDSSSTVYGIHDATRTSIYDSDGGKS